MQWINGGTMAEPQARPLGGHRVVGRHPPCAGGRPDRFPNGHYAGGVAGGGGGGTASLGAVLS